MKQGYMKGKALLFSYINITSKEPQNKIKMLSDENSMLFQSHGNFCDFFYHANDPTL